MVDGKKEEKKVVRKRRSVAKPEHKKLEDTVKKMFDAQGADYFEWLHDKHTKAVTELVIKNQKNIIELLEGE